MTCTEEVILSGIALCSEGAALAKIEFAQPCLFSLVLAQQMIECMLLDRLVMIKNAFKHFTGV